MPGHAKPPFRYICLNDTSRFGFEPKRLSLVYVFKEHHAGLNAGGLQNLLCALHIHRKAVQHWWSQSGSNRRPPACKAGALPAELWPQVFLNSPHNDVRVLAKGFAWGKPMVGLGGLEPPASPLSGVRSNHLSYRPIKLPVETTKHALWRADVQVPCVDVLQQRKLPISKGGDPAAPSDTATLLRLHPSHEPLRGRRPPCG